MGRVMNSDLFDGVIQKLNKKLCLTDDVLRDTPIITLLGNRALFIENYKRIKKFTQEDILIETKIGEVDVEGKKLYMDCYYEDEVMVRGVIKQIILKGVGDNK